MKNSSKEKDEKNHLTGRQIEREKDLFNEITSKEDEC